MPVDLLDLRLTLVKEEELGGQVLHSLHPGPGVARLHRQVPLADHVVRSGGGEHAGVGGAPLHRGDGGAVLLEVGDGTAALRAEPPGSGVRTATLSFLKQGFKVLLEKYFRFRTGAGPNSNTHKMEQMLLGGASPTVEASRLNTATPLDAREQLKTPLSILEI